VVMSYNTLGLNQDAPAVVAAIRASGADVVALQELNPVVAEAIRRELASEYPYQVLDPQPGVTGMGTLSRYPMQLTDYVLPGLWFGTPQVLTLDLDGTLVALLNFHVLAGRSAVDARERAARSVLDFVAAHPGPVIATMDLNATDLSAAYRLLSTALIDSWREAGWGLGHTFPGPPFYSASPDGGDQATPAVPLPTWLLRIDYVFHSPHFTATAAQVGPWDGVSDHQPVVAQLVLQP